MPIIQLVNISQLSQFFQSFETLIFVKVLSHHSQHYLIYKSDKDAFNIVHKLLKQNT